MGKRVDIAVEVVYEDAHNALCWRKKYDENLRCVVQSWEDAQGFKLSLAQKIAALDEALEEGGGDEELELKKLKQYSVAASQCLDDDDDLINDVELSWKNTLDNFEEIIKCVKLLKKEKDAEQSDSICTEERTQCV